MFDLTKPFEVGKLYKRVDGVSVICTQVTILKGYESAQFSDFVECFQRAQTEVTTLAEILNSTDPTWNDPTRSGYRYNRAEDRGRCTGGPWNDFAVIPEPRDEQHVLDYIAHLNRAYAQKD